MKKRISYLALVILLAGTASHAQNKLTGVVQNAENRTVLSDVEVYVKGTTVGVVTNEDGSFTVSTELVQGQIELSMLGYASKTISFNFETTNELNLGIIYLNESTESLDEIVVMARGVIDVRSEERRVGKECRSRWSRNE